MRKLATMFLLAVLALPAFAANQVTVNDLEQAVAAAHGKSDKEVAQRLADLELTQRLSTVRLERLQASLPGDKSRLVLRAIADASAFFDLPAADILPQAGPDSATQGKIMSRAADFAEATVSKLPDFFATRTTTRFENRKLNYEAHGMVTLANRSFSLVDRFSASVTYRNGREVVEAAGGKKGRSNMSSSTGLTSWGEFGPLLGVVVEDILKGLESLGAGSSGSRGGFPIPGARGQIELHREVLLLHGRSRKDARFRGNSAIPRRDCSRSHEWRRLSAGG